MSYCPISGSSRFVVKPSSIYYDLESIGELFRQGQVRIPWASLSARNQCQYLIDEGVRYPESDTTDLIMSVWFGKLGVANH